MAPRLVDGGAAGGREGGHRGLTGERARMRDMALGDRYQGQAAVGLVLRGCFGCRTGGGRGYAPALRRHTQPLYTAASSAQRFGPPAGVGEGSSLLHHHIRQRPTGHTQSPVDHPLTGAKLLFLLPPVSLAASFCLGLDSLGFHTQLAEKQPVTLLRAWAEARAARSSASCAAAEL